MAIYYVNSVGGSNTAPYDTWAKGATTLNTVIAIPVTAADTVYIASDHTQSAAAWAFSFPTAKGLKIISADRTSGAPPVTPTAGATVSGGTAITACSIIGSAYIYGVNFLGGSGNNTASDLNIGVSTSGPHNLIFESCQLHCRGANAGALLQLGNVSNTSNDETAITLVNTAIGVGNASSSVQIGTVALKGVGVTLMGTAPTTLFNMNGGCQAILDFIGCDFSAVAHTNLFAAANNTVVAAKVTFAQTKLRASVTVLSAGTTGPGVEVFVHDCNSGDVHTTFGYYNALGSVVSDTGIYFTSGAAAQSWKIVTNANATFYTPFVTPWFGYYNTVTTAITPYVEILRDGSTTAYQDDEVWLDVMAKTTSGSTASSLTTDRMTLLGTPANHAAGAGLGSWTGESGTAWSGKMVMASLTPAEVGHISARIVVGEPSVTVYADPQIRT